MARKTAILAGGCFWGMEDLFRKLPGVLDTEVGYAGGTTPDPTYEKLKTGMSGHAEALWVEYDSHRLPYRALLEFFFQIHDPSTVDRQGNDVGTAYRSAIMSADDDEIQIAQELIAEIDASGVWPNKVVTQLIKTDVFYKGEDYHQDYLEKNPGGYTCHFIRPNWKL